MTSAAICRAAPAGIARHSPCHQAQGDSACLWSSKAFTWTRTSGSMANILAIALWLHGFEYDLTPYLRSDAPNELVVRAKVEQPCSRWFQRRRHLPACMADHDGPIHVAHWGTSITTPRITRDSADVRRSRRSPEPKRAAKKPSPDDLRCLIPKAAPSGSSQQPIACASGSQARWTRRSKCALPQAVVAQDPDALHGPCQNWSSLI